MMFISYGLALNVWNVSGVIGDAVATTGNVLTRSRSGLASTVFELLDNDDWLVLDVVVEDGATGGKADKSEDAPGAGSVDAAITGADGATGA